MLAIKPGWGIKIQTTPSIRVICGVLGFAGVAAIAFNAYVEGGIEIDLQLLAGLLGGFLFLHVAFFGALPWGMPGDHGDGKKAMSRPKWQMFWAAFVVFLAMATWFLSRKGVFDEASLVVLSMVGFLYALVGVALYFFIKDRPENLG